MSPSEDREDLLATAVAAYIVLLGAHARGLAAYWRTVPLLDDPRARELLQIAAEEEPVGLLYLGEPVSLTEHMPQTALAAERDEPGVSGEPQPEPGGADAGRDRVGELPVEGGGGGCWEGACRHGRSARATARLPAGNSSATPTAPAGQTTSVAHSARPPASPPA